VLQAVTAAGGATDRANESRVNVVRRHESGTRQVFKVNLNNVKKGKEEDILLEEKRYRRGSGVLLLIGPGPARERDRRSAR